MESLFLIVRGIVLGKWGRGEMETKNCVVSSRWEWHPAPFTDSAYTLLIFAHTWPESREQRFHKKPLFALPFLVPCYLKQLIFMGNVSLWPFKLYSRPPPSPHKMTLIITHLLAWLTEPTPCRSVTGLLSKQPPQPSVSMLMSLCHKMWWCLKLCSPPHTPLAPLPSGLAPDQASGDLHSSQDRLADVLPLRCWPDLWLRSWIRARAWLSFSARFRSFITWERCGSGVEKGLVKVASGSRYWESPTLAGIQPCRVMAGYY